MKKVLFIQVIPTVAHATIGKGADVKVPALNFLYGSKTTLDVGADRTVVFIALVQRLINLRPVGIFTDHARYWGGGSFSSPPPAICQTTDQFST